VAVSLTRQGLYLWWPEHFRISLGYPTGIEIWQRGQCTRMYGWFPYVRPRWGRRFLWGRIHGC
jgi:hypothetical protein